MIKQILTILPFALLIAVNTGAAEESGFDEICRIYTEAKNSSMQGEHLSAYIFENVESRINNKDAIQAHAAVFNVDPAQRYDIFKQSAEVSLNTKWDCKAMQELM